jgi:hypothetical protein
MRMVLRLKIDPSLMRKDWPLGQILATVFSAIISPFTKNIAFAIYTNDLAPNGIYNLKNLEK